jgi:hypothetical protein
VNLYLAHFIGDYLLQNDYMAFGKKKSSFICTFHVVTYLLPFLFTGLNWWQLVMVGVQHFIQDRTQIVVWLMRVKGSAKFAEPPCGPWSVIVTDNILHILFIAWVSTLV